MATRSAASSTVIRCHHCCKCVFLICRRRKATQQKHSDMYSASYAFSITVTAVLLKPKRAPRRPNGNLWRGLLRPAMTIQVSRNPNPDLKTRSNTEKRKNRTFLNPLLIHLSPEPETLNPISLNPTNPAGNARVVRRRLELA